SIKHNITLSRLELVSNRGVIDKDREQQAAEDYRENLNIRATSVEQPVGNLSGGNQQKVLVGKGMFSEPDIMMLDEPTRGIDVNAKYEIYSIINRLVGEGKAVLMISSELPELLGMCDRIYVMVEGKIVSELDRKDASQEIIMDIIMQASKGAQKTWAS
ncbi:MAG: ATP-binding cassette domain-containing protein, partial [Eubacteriales bacterium]|nr:ATP-binding cassette domain-containing protein [Eubacteriales bacterium]